MKKSRSVLFSLLGMGALSLPLVAASCGGSGESSDVADYINKEERVAVVKEKSELTAEKLANKEIPSIVLVTDEGRVTDKSFNQSVWEGLLAFRDQVKSLNAEASVEVSSVEPKGGAYAATYDALIGQGQKIWILSGFNHSNSITNYIKDTKKRKLLDDLGVTIISIDFSLPEDVNYPRFYGLNFKTQESAYIVGQAVAEFLSTKYESDTQKRYVSTFGGGDFPGVTDYMIGYLEGVYNYDQTATNKTKVSEVKGSDSLVIDSGFQVNDDMGNAIRKALADANPLPMAILPVAGPGTAETIKQIDAAKLPTLVIGVDVDQSKSLAQSAGKFMTSVTKNMAQAVYDTLLYTVFGVDPNNVFAGKAADKPFNHLGTKKEGWVGYAPSTLSDQADRDKMNALLDKYNTAFNALSEQEIAEKTKTSEGETKGIAYANSIYKKINAL
ncbi:BMP family ABC transporter substrate-binding protein [Mycoplasma nasistruthionis]|uniref:BMP family ABC transporter substrate-binding protein n=1 Tax=Mycoplasma nasistruthionis TaxID=353852 RepID=A0A5B7XWA1_9MOLU|nr:BMP family ABC transporter substrate-binding protein [Mycoplasma nasistruthionis]QCZ36794.1 BMP family ABC transporter substrate-binding protein [Mycoplasma nasistruthionis]